MHPEIDRYAHIDSPIHRWDPGLKIVGFGVFVVAVALLSKPASAFVGLAFSFLLLSASKIPVPFVLGRLKFLLLALAPFFLLLPVTVVSQPEWSVTWEWSREWLALLLTLRALAIGVAVFPMLGTAPFHLSMKALQDLGFPKTIVQAVLFSYRYLFVYLDQLRRMRVAARSRGFRPGLNRRSFRVFGYQVGMLLVTSYEQTERILKAMKSRGYDGTIRTLHASRRAPADWFKLGAVLATALLLTLGDRLWIG